MLVAQRGRKKLFKRHFNGKKKNTEGSNIFTPHDNKTAEIN